MFFRILTTDLKWTIVEWAMIDISAVANIERQFSVPTCVIMVERMRLIMCILVEFYIKIVEYASIQSLIWK